MDEIDLGKEWLGSSRHLRLPETSATRGNQGMDKSHHSAQLKIRDEPLICPLALVSGTGEKEIDLNLAQQPGLTGCRSLLEERIDSAN
jgi:hypothetical protein